MITKSADAAPSPQGFETLTRRLVAVPKAEFDKAMKADKERKQGRRSA